MCEAYDYSRPGFYHDLFLMDDDPSSFAHIHRLLYLCNPNSPNNPKVLNNPNTDLAHTHTFTASTHTQISSAVIPGPHRSCTDRHGHIRAVALALPPPQPCCCSRYPQINGRASRRRGRHWHLRGDLTCPTCTLYTSSRKGPVHDPTWRASSFHVSFVSTTPYLSSTITYNVRDLKSTITSMAPDHCTIYIQSHGHVTAVYSNSSRPSTAALIKSATQHRIFDSTNQHCVTCLSSQGHVTAVYIYKPSNSEALLVFKSSTQHRTFESADHCTAYIPSYGQDTAVYSYRPSVAGFLLIKSSTQHRIFQSTAPIHAVIIPHLAASHSPLILPPALHSMGAREQHTALTGLFLYRLIGPFILFHHYHHRSTD
jgi:hypothetical protein